MDDTSDEIGELRLRADAGSKSGRRLIGLVRTLLAKGGTLESTNASAPIDRAILAGVMERHIEHNRRALEARPSLTAKIAAKETLDIAERAIRRVGGGVAIANLTDLEYASLEAIVQVVGRPAMRYANGSVEMPPDDLGENGRWRTLIATARSKINRVSASVGRISLRSAGQTELKGTGWRPGNDLVVTNRHVLQCLVDNPGDPQPSWRIDTSNHPTIEFTDGGSLTIGEWVYCAPEERIDFAVLRLTAGAGSLPPALPIDLTADSGGGRLVRNRDSTAPRYTS
jgi:hypothetical protein